MSANSVEGVDEVLVAAEPVKAVTKALEGVYGFADGEPVDTRHFGPPNNDFPPLTYGDLRRLAAAVTKLEAAYAASANTETQDAD